MTTTAEWLLRRVGNSNLSGSQTGPTRAISVTVMKRAACLFLFDFGTSARKFKHKQQETETERERGKRNQSKTPPKVEEGEHLTRKREMLYTHGEMATKRQVSKDWELIVKKASGVLTK